MDGKRQPTSGPPLDRARIERALEPAVREIRALGAAGVVVGVAGGSCSGKSTLAAALARQLGDAAILELDHYYLAQRVSGEAFDANFDCPEALDLELLREHIDSLRRGIDIERPVYDFRRHRRAGYEPFAARRFLLVDGLFALHPALGAVDFGIYVDCSEGERLRRRIARDSAERGRTEAGILYQYATTVRPMHRLHVEQTRSRADLVFPNDPDPSGGTIYG